MKRTFDDLQNELELYKAELKVFKSMMDSKDISYTKCNTLGCDKCEVWFQGHGIGGTVDYYNNPLIPIKIREESQIYSEYDNCIWTCKEHLQSDDQPISYSEGVDIGYFGYDEECEESKEEYELYLKVFKK